MPSLLCRIGLIAIVFFSSKSHAEAIWIVCDYCSADSSFTDTALSASGHNGMIFVSNRWSGETKKFHRLSQWDRISRSFKGRVAPRAFLDGEKAAFDAALENGRTGVVALPRNGSAISHWGLPSAGSVVEDVGNGQLSPTLINAISNHVLLAGMFPTAPELSQSLGFSIRGIFDWSGRHLGTSRNTVLNVIVHYQDGSQVFITFSRLGEILSISAVDAAGNALAIQFSSNAGAVINPESPGAWEFSGDASAAAGAFGVWIGGSGSLNCHFEEMARDRVRVTCVRD